MKARTANIASFLSSMAATDPFGQAVLAPQGEDGSKRPSYVQVNYSQLEEMTSVLAAGLKKSGVERGSRAVLLVPPGVDLYALTFALFKLGAVPVMVDPGMGPRNLKKCIDEARPSAFIGTAKAHVFRVLSGAGRDSVNLKVKTGGGFSWGAVSYGELFETGREQPPFKPAETRPEDMAAILFTSGSTGVPKGVVYTHKVFISQIHALKKIYNIEKGEKDLPTFPLFGLFGPALGMTEIIPDMNPSRPASVDPVKIINAINTFGITNIFGSPALIDRVGRYGVSHGIKLPSIRRVISAGAPVSPLILERFCKMLNDGVEIHTPYGATEALPVSTIGSSEILTGTWRQSRHGAGVCVGRPVLKNRLKIVDIRDEVIETWSDSLEVEKGCIGEVVVSGEVVTSTYFSRAASTELAKIYSDPERSSFYHRMGDVGYLDSDGRLWFCGRKSHRVVTEDGTLFTVQCEAIFNTHPEVCRTALVGVKTGAGTLPVLCVELEPPVNRGDLRRLRAEILSLGAGHNCTNGIKTLLFHKAFPVDVRHNAKIFREKLAVWAQRKVGKR